MHRLLCLAVVLSAAPAAAEELAPEPAPDASATFAEQGFVGGGFALSVDHFIHTAFALEAGIKLPAMPLWVRGGAELGSAFDFAGGGAFRRAQIGLEARGCVGPWVCGLAGLEAGYQTMVWESDEDPTEHHHGALVTGRTGLDVGGAHLRVRLTLELSSFRHAADFMDYGDRWIAGAGLGLGLVYRL